MNFKHEQDIRKFLEELKEVISPSIKEFFTINEACKYLGISRTHLYYLRKNNLVESKLIGSKKVVITRQSINEFVFGGERKANIGLSFNEETE